jgi:hypothetical protein
MSRMTRFSRKGIEQELASALPTRVVALAIICPPTKEALLVQVIF